MEQVNSIKENFSSIIQSKDANHASGEIVRLVTFLVNDRRYAVRVDFVKEIAKIDQITRLPNAYNFVKGVYNLRGEIVPIIDMKHMFGCGSTRHDGFFNVVILQIEKHTVGVIVEKMLGVENHPQSSISPMHSLMGKIDVRFVEATFRQGDHIYWIIDAVEMFVTEKNIDFYQEISRRYDEEKKLEKKKNEIDLLTGRQKTETEVNSSRSMSSKRGVQDDVDTAISLLTPFLQEEYGLEINQVNTDWFQDILSNQPNLSEILEQLRRGDLFLVKNLTKKFFSRCYEEILDDDLVEDLQKELKSFSSLHNLRILDIGCGNGAVTYSFAAICKEFIPVGHMAVFACDKELAKINETSSLDLSKQEVPYFLKKYVTENKGKKEISQDLVDQINFEYHNILNESFYEKLHLVVMRDLLSCLTEDEQEKLMVKLEKITEPKCFLLLGDHEILPKNSFWEKITGTSLSMYKKIR